MRKHSDEILCGCFSKSSNLVVSSDDGAFICWNVDSGLEKFYYHNNLI
jgi:WD40 repeat protein